MRVDYDSADYLPGHRWQGFAWRLLRPGRETHRAAHGRGDRALARDAAACPSPASAASPTGATRWISSRWAPAPCRCARPRWSTASRSSTTWWMALATISTARASLRCGELVGKAVPSVTDWQYLNLNHVDKAWIDQDLCIKCGRCHIVCEDTSHQAITATVNGARHFEVIDAECVGCNLCVSVCPVENCITMRPMTERRRSAHRPRDHAARKPTGPHTRTTRDESARDDCVLFVASDGRYTSPAGRRGVTTSSWSPSRTFASGSQKPITDSPR